MFPYRDNLQSTRFPLGVTLIVLLNVLVFWKLYQLPVEVAELYTLQYGFIPEREFSLFLSGDTVNAAIPFLSSLFLHGGLLHLAANMWSLWIFGDHVESVMGTNRFLIFYLLCGILACLCHAVLNPGSTLPVVGASGAISGVMAAYLFCFPSARLKMFTLLIIYPIFFEIPAYVFLVLWFFIQLFSGTSDLAAGQAVGRDIGGVAFFAHVGGFVAGAVLLPLISRQKRSR